MGNNVSRAKGLKPVQNLQGGAWTGKATPYYANKDGTTPDGAIGIGSVVALGKASLASEDGNGIRVIRPLTSIVMTAGSAPSAISSLPLGVVVGFDIDPTNLNIGGSNFRASSTARLVYVCDDPNAIFEIQEDSNGGVMPAAHVGLNAIVTSETVSTTTGYSNLELDTSADAVTANFPLRILSFARRVDNEVSSSYAKVIVKFTRHALATDFSAETVVGAA